MRIIIPGGSGSLGTLLAQRFSRAGHEVIVLSRTPQAAGAWQTLMWDARTRGEWAETLDGADACINLAGRSINCRMTPQNRRAVYDSRIDATRVLHSVISSLAHPPRVWLNASTATIYRHALDHAMDEDTGEIAAEDSHDPETWRFSEHVARDWESALFVGSLPLTRRVALRTSIVMTNEPNGAFAILSRLARLGLGGAQGSGRQYLSWMHEEDFIAAIEWIVQNDAIAGPVNMTAPEPLPNAELMRQLRHVWRVPIGLPATEWMIELGTRLMRTESELVLKSRWVVPGRLLDSGFRFRYAHWMNAASDLAARLEAR